MLLWFREGSQVWKKVSFLWNCFITYVIIFIYLSTINISVSTLHGPWNGRVSGWRGVNFVPLTPISSESLTPISSESCTESAYCCSTSTAQQILRPWVIYNSQRKINFFFEFWDLRVHWCIKQRSKALDFSAKPRVNFRLLDKGWSSLTKVLGYFECSSSRDICWWRHWKFLHQSIQKMWVIFQDSFALFGGIVLWVDLQDL